MKKSKGLLATIAALLFTTFGAAQNAGAQDQGATTLEEIFVTARRIEENLQDTPIAISAYSPETLEKRQIFDLIIRMVFVILKEQPPMLLFYLSLDGHLGSENSMLLPMLRILSLKDISFIGLRDPTGFIPLNLVRYLN